MWQVLRCKCYRCHNLTCAGVGVQAWEALNQVYKPSVAQNNCPTKGRMARKHECNARCKREQIRDHEALCEDWSHPLFAKGPFAYYSAPSGRLPKPLPKWARDRRGAQ